MPTDDAAFAKTFDTLRKLFAPYAKTYPPIVDEPGRYYLATKASKTKSGSPIWFGGVEIKKNYVSFHLIPVYGNPALLKDASPSLLKRKQGKSCFNFTAIEPAHVKELSAITKRGFAGFVKKFP
jgi:hypothetical protein